MGERSADAQARRNTLCGRPVATDRALVMAIVNRTPDSFYDRGATFGDAAALAAVARAVDEGADLVDIGGVKAGPGSEVDAAEETTRVVPFVAAIRARYPELLISVDTWRGSVARAAVGEGADLINDTWAGADPELVHVAAELGVGVVCSHTGGSVPRTRPHRIRYDRARAATGNSDRASAATGNSDRASAATGNSDRASAATGVVSGVVGEVLATLVAAAEAAAALGIPRDSILIDPTHDFGKNTFHGLELLRRVDVLVNTGWPVLMALSNKDFIGETLGVGLAERLEGTLAATALAAEAGARVFRVHEVAATRRVVDMVAAIKGIRMPVRPTRGLA